jgi:hypothetical protein
MELPLQVRCKTFSGERLMRPFGANNAKRTGLPPRAVKLAGVASSGDDRVYYTVRLHPSGAYTCSCPVRHKCKHIAKAIAATLAFTGTDAEFRYKLPVPKE